jgi:hypothetical protein
LRVAATIRARQDLGEDIEITLDVGRAEEDPTRALDAALRLAERLAERDGRRVVVFFDEFQDIATGRFGDADTITRKIRAVFQRSSSVSVLFAGSIEHLMRDLFAPSERALSQPDDSSAARRSARLDAKRAALEGSFHELAPIAAAEWAEGIRARLATDRTSITDDALARLVELGEGHPRVTMLIAQQAHGQALEELVYEIDHAVVVAALERALSSEQLRHQQQLELFVPLVDLLSAWRSVWPPTPSSTGI